MPQARVWRKRTHWRPFALQAPVHLPYLPQNLCRNHWDYALRLQTSDLAGAAVLALLARGCAVPAIVLAFGLDQCTVADWHAERDSMPNKSRPTPSAKASWSLAKSKPMSCMPICVSSGCLNALPFSRAPACSPLFAAIRANQVSRYRWPDSAQRAQSMQGMAI